MELRTGIRVALVLLVLIGSAAMSGGAGALVPSGEAATATISGRVFSDLDGDGMADPPEPGVAAVAVHLTGTTATGDPVTRSVTTDATGTFFFGALPSASYRVAVTPPPGFTVSSSTPSPSAPITLAPGQSQTGVNFALVLPSNADIGDEVFADLNGDGRRAANEPGIPGVTLRLLVDVDGDGNPDADPGATAKSDAAGRYLFADLPPGAYFVDVTAPAGYSGSTRVPVLLTGQDNLAVDFGLLPSGSTTTTTTTTAPTTTTTTTAPTTTTTTTAPTTTAPTTTAPTTTAPTTTTTTAPTTTTTTGGSSTTSTSVSTTTLPSTSTTASTSTTIVDPSSSSVAPTTTVVAPTTAEPTTTRPTGTLPETGPSGAGVGWSMLIASAFVAVGASLLARRRI